jgi:glycosidase
MRLLLDFVPNHTAPDHHWVREHPDYYVEGSADDLARSPQNYCRIETADGPRILAHGRDPLFDGWPDTLQLNYGNPRLREAVRYELERVAAMCDGVRCDMAMLLLPDVFRRTWNIEAPEFWADTIETVRSKRHDFVFMAEVYWGLEWELLQRGFDYTYDKRLYDRLRGGEASGVRDHLVADLGYQNRLVRFIENHDEARAAALFPPHQHRAAAVVTFFAPGMRLFHDGQWQGRRRHASVHLCRRAEESADDAISDFYERLLLTLKRPQFHSRSWRRLEPAPASPDNESWRNFIASICGEDGSTRSIVVVNYSRDRAQCRLPVTPGVPAHATVELRDLLGDAIFYRDGSELVSPGLYLDMPAWGYHVFEVLAAGK